MLWRRRREDAVKLADAAKAAKRGIEEQLDDAIAEHAEREAALKAQHAAELAALKAQHADWAAELKAKHAKAQDALTELPYLKSKLASAAAELEASRGAP